MRPPKHSARQRLAGKRAAGFSLALLLAGCAAGPDFQRPAAPAASAYVSGPLAPHTASAAIALGQAQRLHPGAAVDPQWWRQLGSPQLDSLIGQALHASPTLAAAQATLMQAEETYAAQAGATRYPRLDASLGGQRQRLAPAALGQAGDARVFDLYNAALGVQYRLDLAGGNRRALEALAARADYQGFRLQGAQLTLAARIAGGAIAQARLAAQIQATETLLRLQLEQLHIASERVRLGHASDDEVRSLRAAAEQTRAAIPLLRTQWQQTGHLLAVLAGQAPGTAGQASFALADFTLPSDLPLIVPSELVRSRPDIQAAEALLHAANAEYGVAVARLYPQINLSASFGAQALTAGGLFGGGSAVWSLAGQLAQPLFNPGLPAEKRAALAAFDAAAANYQEVVLESLRNVADILRAIENNAERLAALAVADRSAQEALQSMQRQYQAGASSYVQLLLAQQQAQQSQFELIAAQAQRLSDSVVLYQALGGGPQARLRPSQGT